MPSLTIRLQKGIRLSARHIILLLNAKIKTNTYQNIPKNQEIFVDYFRFPYACTICFIQNMSGSCLPAPAFCIQTAFSL